MVRRAACSCDEVAQPIREEGQTRSRRKVKATPPSMRGSFSVSLIPELEGVFLLAKHLGAARRTREESLLFTHVTGVEIASDPTEMLRLNPIIPSMRR